VVLLLSGCANQKSVEQLAAAHHLQRQTVTTNRFSHLLIENHVGESDDDLHVYIEGDGTPWLRRNVIAADPTPRNPLAFKLMLQDPAPSIYLGRPCYFGLMDSPDCLPPIWTHRRYSEEVIASMQSALEQYLRGHTYQQVTLIGYSGGGVIAMLLAERIPHTQRIITISANLDIDAWARHHDYSSLSGSLNPATRPPLPPSITQIHFAGKHDENVPVAIIKSVAARQNNSAVRVMEKFDHICCWEKEWSRLLKQL
jgi:hypothetical protein